MSLILLYQLHSYFMAINLPSIKNKKRSFFRIIKKLMTVYVLIYLWFTVLLLPIALNLIFDFVEVTK